MSKVQRSTNSPTGPNDVGLVATHNYYNIYLIETKGQLSGRFIPTHPSLQPKLARRGSDAM